MALILLRIAALNNGAECLPVLDVGLGKVLGALRVLLDSLVNIRVAMVNECPYRMNVGRSILVKPLVNSYGLRPSKATGLILDGSV